MNRTRMLVSCISVALLGAVGCGRMDDPPPIDQGQPGQNVGTCLSGCNRGFMCQGVSCVLDPLSLWSITVTSGKISERDPTGASWDTFGGAPDPLVCLTINGQRSCTRTAQDTISPVWNQSFPPATAASLASGVSVEIWDEDVSSNDPICGSGTLTVSKDQFAQGTWGASCAEGSFQAVLSAR